MTKTQGWMLAAVGVLGGVGFILWSMGARAREVEAASARLAEALGTGSGAAVGLEGMQVAALVVWGLGALVLLAVLVGVAVKR